MGVYRIAASVHFAGDQHDVADLQFPGFGFRNRSAEEDFLTGAGRFAAGAHLLPGLFHVTIEPAFDRTCASIQDNSQAPECPAVVGHRNEEAGWEPVDSTDLAADQS